MKMMNNYINIQTTNNNVPSFTDSTHGKETALKLIGQGCDVVFGVGGNTVNGVLLAAKENNLPAIGADVDEYNTYPEAQSALITRAMKNVNVAVYNYLKSVEMVLSKLASAPPPCKTAASAWLPSMIGTARSQPL